MNCFSTLPTTIEGSQLDWVTLRTIHRQRPFEPYKILTAVGDQHRVPSPESMSVLGNERAVVVQSGADFEVIDLASVTAVLPVDPGHSATASETEPESD